MIRKTRENKEAPNQVTGNTPLNSTDCPILLLHSIIYNGYVKNSMQFCWGQASTALLSHSQWRAWPSCLVLWSSLQVVKPLPFKDSMPSNRTVCQIWSNSTCWQCNRPISIWCRAMLDSVTLKPPLQRWKIIDHVWLYLLRLLLMKLQFKITYQLLN